jgi:hypothetical protein
VTDRHDWRRDSYFARLLKRNQQAAEKDLTMKQSRHQSDVKRAFVTPVKRAGASLLCAAVTLCLTTATISAADPAPVNLGAAAPFGVLGASTVTNTGPTTINGNLGLWPGTSVTGFPPGIMNGTMHVAESTAQQAQASLAVAFNDTFAQTAGRIVVGTGDLTGQTLGPGLYNSGSSMLLTGDLTLDGRGDTNAVWIFQAGSTLTTMSGSRVILINGAKASNVFWVVGSSATLGTYSIFKGTIMAYASITIATGATVDGRALARTAAVTLDTNIVTVQTSSPVTARCTP